MTRFIVSYRSEFSTVVEANNKKDALAKVAEKPYGYQWEPIGDLHSDFLEIDDDDNYED